MAEMDDGVGGGAVPGGIEIGDVRVAVRIQEHADVGFLARVHVQLQPDDAPHGFPFAQRLDDLLVGGGDVGALLDCGDQRMGKGCLGPLPDAAQLLLRAVLIAQKLLELLSERLGKIAVRAVLGFERLGVIPFGRAARAQEKADYAVEMRRFFQRVEILGERLICVAPPKLGAERMHAVQHLAAADRRADDLAVRAVRIGQHFLGMGVDPVGGRGDVEPQHDVRVRHGAHEHIQIADGLIKAVEGTFVIAALKGHVGRLHAGVVPGGGRFNIVDLQTGLAQILQIGGIFDGHGDGHRGIGLAVDHDGRLSVVAFDAGDGHEISSFITGALRDTFGKRRLLFTH